MLPSVVLSNVVLGLYDSVPFSLLHPAMNLKQPVATGTRVQPLTIQQVQVRNQSLTPHHAQTQSRIPSLTPQQTQALLTSQLQSLSQAQAQALLSAISGKTYGGLEGLADECLQNSLGPVTLGGQVRGGGGRR